jgi:ABC-type dipeptide transport system, periplasmic component
MKKWRKAAAIFLSLIMLAALAACSGGGESSTNDDTKVSTPVSEATEPASEPKEESKADEPEIADTAEGDTPREETLYFGTGQWGPVINNNPLSGNSNNSLCVEQSDMARVLVHETAYMFNMLDGKAHPLLADGDYSWNDDNTAITYKIKAAAKWSDGTPVTAHDAAYTFDTHVKYETNQGVDFGQYIESVTALDDQTVEVKAKADNYNMLKVESYLPKVYILQKAYLEKLEEETGGVAEEMKNAEFWDAPHSGPYEMLFNSNQKIVLQRDDNYWGQDASMWGELPAPKYVAHNIFADNNAMGTAFEAGEIDVNQQYLAEIEKTWEEKGLPISTYIDEAPYQMAATMPSAVFNMNREGLDQKVIRQAIAYAVNYEQIISAAMTGQSPTFEQYPRSLFNPSEPQRALIRDEAKLAEYQWAGNDIERANKLLDDAGIVDTDGDGIREYNGKKLSFTAECPTGWSDWEAGLSIVSAAGKEIGIELETNYPEAAQWTENVQTGNFDITMDGTTTGISAPWSAAYNIMYGFGGNFPEVMSFNRGRFYNERVDELLALIPNETDDNKLKEYWEELNIIYLEEVPSFALMYRPAYFHEVSETVWTGFPTEGDGSNIPPQVCCSGYGIAALYNIENIN